LNIIIKVIRNTEKMSKVLITIDHAQRFTCSTSYLYGNISVDVMIKDILLTLRNYNGRGNMVRSMDIDAFLFMKLSYLGQGRYHLIPL